MTGTQILLTYVISNLVAIAFLITSFKRKRLARILFAALFLWAAYTNWNVANSNPAYYLGYTKYALPWYRDFIIGPFSNHITLIVSSIAICQLLIGCGLLWKGPILKTSYIGGITFLLAICPLGILSAFPSGLIWSAGLLVLYRHPYYKNIFFKKMIVSKAL